MVRHALLPALTVESAISLKVEAGSGPGWELELRGRWRRGAEEDLVAAVAGRLRGPQTAEPAAGTVTIRPIRLPGGIVIGARRIAIDVTAGALRLQLDRDPGPPPYLMGITLSGRLGRPAGADPGDDGVAEVEDEVKVWIHPAQVLDLWLRLNL